MIKNENYNYDKLIKEINGCLNLKQFSKSKLFIIKNLADKMDTEKINNLFNNNIQIEMLDERELYLITETFYRMLLNEDFLSKLNEDQQQLQMALKPSLYFTEEEITKYKNLMYIKEEKNDFEIITFKNCLLMKEGIYKTVVDFNYLLDIRESGKLFYNIDCQRETEKYKWRGIYMEKPKIYTKSIVEMSDSMEKDEYIPTDLAINVPSNGEESFHAIDKGNGLYDIIIKLDENTLLNLPDGNHRMTAGSIARKRCKDKRKEFRRRMGLNIMNLDTMWARHYIAQESKKNPINENLIKSMEMSIENKIARYFNKGSISENPLSNRLGREVKDVKYLGKLTTIYVFAEGVRYFNIDEHDIIEEDKIKRYLKEYFKYILSFHKNELRDIDKSRETSFALNMNIFKGYLYIANKLKNIKNWQEKLISILYKIDYSKEGALSEFNLSKDEMNRGNIKKLEEYLDNIIREEVLTDEREFKKIL